MKTGVMEYVGSLLLRIAQNRQDRCASEEDPRRTLRASQDRDQVISQITGRLGLSGSTRSGWAWKGAKPPRIRFLGAMAS